MWSWTNTFLNLLLLHGVTDSSQDEFVFFSVFWHELTSIRGEKCRLVVNKHFFLPSLSSTLSWWGVQGDWECRALPAVFQQPMRRHQCLVVVLDVNVLSPWWASVCFVFSCVVLLRPITCPHAAAGNSSFLFSSNQKLPISASRRWSVQTLHDWPVLSSVPLFSRISLRRSSAPRWDFNFVFCLSLIGWRPFD